MNKLRKASYLIIGSMEKAFFRWGELVGLYPWRVILSSIFITGLASLGMFYFRIEQQANKLWIPPWSNFNTHQEWLTENFQSRQRDELILMETDNVLTPQSILKMYEVYKKISEIEVNGKTFKDMCFKVPVANIFHTEKRRRRRRNAADPGNRRRHTAEDPVNRRRREAADPAKRRRRTADPVEIGQNPGPHVHENNTSLEKLILGPTFGNIRNLNLSRSEVEATTIGINTDDDYYQDTTERSIASNPSGKELPVEENHDEERDEYSSEAAEGGDDFFWNDYEDYDYENYVEISKDDPKYYKPEPRINYELFGFDTEDEDSDDSSEEQQDSSPLYELPPDVRCGVTSTLQEKCLMTSLLEIWRYKEELINTTTQQEIIDAINLLERSPWTSHKINFTEQLGGVERNASGHVVRARAAQLYWNIEVPDDVELITGVGGGVEITFADADTLEWETRFIDTALAFDFPGFNILPNAVRSFGDLNEQAILFDVIKLVIGYIMMFVYTVFMLGRINKLEIRLYLTAVGIISVGMGIVMGVGLASLLGYPYTPIHSALPFLCLGIGIDDMFVIVQCWYNMKKQEPHDIPLPLALGHTLRHAGVSVTITTLTDVFAFAVGAITIMPGLESFCVCTAIALGSIYLLQISWFSAFLALDQRRIMAKRNAIVPCIVHEHYQVNKPSEVEDNSSKFLKFYSKVLESKAYRGFIIVASIGLVCVSGWGASMIQQKFDPNLLLPLDTYLRKYLGFAETLFPDNGWDTSVYTGKINYTQLDNIDKLYNGMAKLKDERVYIRNYDGFWDGLKEYAADAKNYKTISEFSSPELFPLLLSDFLHSADGGKYKKDFLFDGKLVCGKPAPPVIATKFTVNLKVFKGPDTHIPARRAIERVINASDVSDVAFSHVKVYAAWETDEIIGDELLRNIGLALGVISIITLILLTDLRICAMAFICVVMTLTDIVGFLHFWGITIDIISAVSIVLAIGLCVDYCVHIGHAFLIAPGSRLEKSMNALETIGPAVFNGGFTTLLAVIVMAFSKSSVFLTFFKVFFLTVTFGLFHGLILLPVILSVLGPVGHPEDKDSVAGNSQSTSGTTSGTSSGSSSPPSYPSVIGLAHANLAYIKELEDDKNKEIMYSNQPEDKNSEASSDTWRTSNLVKVFGKKTGSMDLRPTP